MAKITKNAVVNAIAKIKEVNVWALTDNVELTFDHETQQVIVWNAVGDYDAWYEESEVDAILAEAKTIETFYTNPTRVAIKANNDWAIRMGVTPAK